MEYYETNLTEKQKSEMDEFNRQITSFLRIILVIFIIVWIIGGIILLAFFRKPEVSAVKSQTLEQNQDGTYNEEVETDINVSTTVIISTPKMLK